MAKSITLRPWQSEAINKCLKWFLKSNEKRFLINAAPGAGKTICASVLAKELLEREKIERVVVIAPRNEVVKQWAEEYEFVTEKFMMKVTGSDEDILNNDTDICLTWASVSSSADELKKLSKKNKTLVICDEHHHAAVNAVWGIGADTAFKNIVYSIILTGTPIRSDGEEPVWFAYNDEGKIEHPDDGTFNLTYGEAVNLGYCRPITFHRHEGKFEVQVDENEFVKVSGLEEVKISKKLKSIKGIKEALNYYKLVCTPRFLSNNKTPDPNSYQASMIKVGIDKLQEAKRRLHNAGGLVIAPNIFVAEHMANLLETITGDKPILVHSELVNSDNKISSFRNSKKDWIVSVAMISEGVDIKRLRVLLYLPNSQTELSFRQAMGRIVRTMGPDDDSISHVVLPTYKVLENYARKVEEEMTAADVKPKIMRTKKCPSCETEVPLGDKNCPICNHKFETTIVNFKICDKCNHKNPINASKCEKCNNSFQDDYKVELKDALRVGVIVRGLDMNEDEIQNYEMFKDDIRDNILKSGDETLLKLMKTLPDESFARLKKILDK